MHSPPPGQHVCACDCWRLSFCKIIGYLLQKSLKQSRFHVVHFVCIVVSSLSWTSVLQQQDFCCSGFDPVGLITIRSSLLSSLPKFSLLSRSMICRTANDL